MWPLLPGTRGNTMQHWQIGKFKKTKQKSHRMDSHQLNCSFLLKMMNQNHHRLSHPDFQLFKNYKRFMKRTLNAKLYLVDPRSIWKLWRVLHIYTGRKIRRNPPSSGFIGESIYYNILGTGNAIATRALAHKTILVQRRQQQHRRRRQPHEC